MLRTIRGIDGARVALNFSGYTLELLNGEHRELYEGSAEAVALLRELVGGRSRRDHGHELGPRDPADPAARARGRGRRPLSRDRGPRSGRRARRVLPARDGDRSLSAGGAGCRRLSLLVHRRGPRRDEPPRRPQRLQRVRARGAVARPPDRARQVPRSPLAARPPAARGAPPRSHSVREPFDWLGTGGATLAAIPCDAAWLAYSLICLSRVAMLSERRFVRAGRARGASGRRDGLLLPYFGDIEFFGYGGNTIKEPIPVERLELLLRALAESPDTGLVLPGAYAREAADRQAAPAAPASPRPAVYVKSGSWSSQRDFALLAARARQRRAQRSVRAGLRDVPGKRKAGSTPNAAPRSSRRFSSPGTPTAGAGPRSPSTGCSASIGRSKRRECCSRHREGGIR